jgi:transposase
MKRGEIATRHGRPSQYSAREPERSRPMSADSDLRITASDRALLEQSLQSATVTEAWARRARILLARADGEGVRQLARRLGVSTTTICRWQDRYKTEGLAGLQSRPRPGRPRRISAGREHSILARTLEPPPHGVQWSARRLAKEEGLSPTTVHRIWQKHGVQPRRPNNLDAPPSIRPHGARRDRLSIHEPAGAGARPGSLRPGPREDAQTRDIT